MGSQINLVDLFSLAPEEEIHTHDRLRITRITTGYLDSIGSIFIDLFGTRAKFHVFDGSFPLPGNGIVGLEFLRKDKAEISFHHNTVILSNNPIKPIPFITLRPLENAPASAEPIVDVSQVQLLRRPSAATDRHVLRARTRQVIPVKVINKDIKEGFLPPVDSPEGVFIGQAAVSVHNGRCFVLPINSTEEEIEVQIAPQELTPYDVFDDESDCLDEILTSGKTSISHSKKD